MEHLVPLYFQNQQLLLRIKELMDELEQKNKKLEDIDTELRNHRYTSTNACYRDIISAAITIGNYPALHYVIYRSLFKNISCSNISTSIMAMIIFLSLVKL